jgi:hypothetical protein
MVDRVSENKAVICLQLLSDHKREVRDDMELPFCDCEESICQVFTQFEEFFPWDITCQELCCDNAGEKNPASGSFLKQPFSCLMMYIVSIEESTEHIGVQNNIHVR